MSITSFGFFIFVAISLLIYWVLPKGWQWVMLLIDSIVFYFLSARPYTIVYMLISIVTVFFATKYFTDMDAKAKAGTIERDEADKKKHAVMVLTLVVNFGILIVLKYTNLGIHTVNFIFGGLGVQLNEVTWLSSLAVSFYTLQIVSYLLDCYWGVATATTNIGKLALFTCYFPQMTSGPISRWSDLEGQLYTEHRFDYDRVTNGIKRIGWGLMKKAVISNRIGIIVDYMWADTTTFSGIYIWIAAMGYALQLYTDFSGCMDILFGVSECFGIFMPENFNAPMFSKTSQEFWQRWHITLGTWLRDYIMNPILKSRFMINVGKKSKEKLGKKKGKKIPVYFSMLFLWSAMGLWHGNSWRYIVGEGLWYWIVIVLGQVLEGLFTKQKAALHINEEGILWKTWQVIRTFLIFSVGMLFFRADSFRLAINRIVISVSRQVGLGSAKALGSFIYNTITVEGLICMVIAFIMMFIFDINKYRGRNMLALVNEKPAIVRWLLYAVIILLITFSLGVTAQSFAYAQF